MYKSNILSFLHVLIHIYIYQYTHLHNLLLAYASCIQPFQLRLAAVILTEYCYTI